MTDTRFVLAFFGIRQSPGGVEDILSLTEKWFVTLGFSPDKLGIDGKGHSGKVGDFRRNRSKLRKSGFESVTGFSLRCSFPESNVSGMEYYAAASVAFSSDDGGHIVTATPVSPTMANGWRGIARQIVDIASPKYGIGFSRDLGSGPIWYALGINQSRGEPLSGDAYEEERTISRWCNVGMPMQVWRQGLLRDVYQWNFLTKPQLNRPVRGIPLRQWIESDPRRGRLSRFAGEMFLWEVQDSQILELREELRAADVIFDWRKFQ